MADFLSDPVWQGIGVIVTILFSSLSLWFTLKSKKLILGNNNADFENFSLNPKEVLDGQDITLSGIVEKQLYPGPPNYESIDDGDHPQFYWILYTSKPIGIVSRSFENEELIENGKSCSFQLLVPPEFYESKNYVLGKLAKATGTIFVGHCGHHKTKALLQCKVIEVL